MALLCLKLSEEVCYVQLEMVNFYFLLEIYVGYYVVTYKLFRRTDKGFETILEYTLSTEFSGSRASASYSNQLIPSHNSMYVGRSHKVLNK